MATTIIDTLAQRSAGRNPMLEEAAGCGGSCSTPPTKPARLAFDSPPVRCEGVEIPEAEIAREMQHHEGADLEEARASAARALIVRMLLLGRAQALGLAPEPEQDALGRWECDEEALIRQVLAAEAVPPEPTEAECLRVYQRSPDRFDGAFEKWAPVIRDHLKARAWVAASARYVAGLVRAARIEGLDVLHGAGP